MLAADHSAEQDGADRTLTPKHASGGIVSVSKTHTSDLPKRAAKRRAPSAPGWKVFSTRTEALEGMRACLSDQAGA